MTNFRKQLEAMGTALLFVQKLPPNTVWSLTCTNDDDADSPGVLNIYTTESNWFNLASILDLKKITDRSTTENGDQFVSYKVGTLMVSFIQTESA